MQNTRICVILTYIYMNRNTKNFNPTILYEDDSCLVIDKPADIMAHPDEKSEGYTISDWMGDAYPSSIEVDKERPGIVHRLDRDTTGCMLLVKNAKAYNYFKSQFQDKTIKKVYLAIVVGNIKDDTGIIDTPIARARSDFRKREVKNDFTKDYRGEEREAITRYKVIERIDGPLGKFTVVECFPLTGRTHQIRVHMRSIRHPIVGDKLYGSRESASLAERQMLHATRLEFKNKNEKISLQSPAPKDFLDTLEKLR